MDTVKILIADSFSADFMRGFSTASETNWEGLTIITDNFIPDSDDAEGIVNFDSHGDAVAGTFLNQINMLEIPEGTQYEIHLVDTGNDEFDFTQGFQESIVDSLAATDFDIVNYSFVSSGNTQEFMDANIQEMDEGALIFSSLPNQGQEAWAMDSGTMDSLLDVHHNHISVGAVHVWDNGIYLDAIDNADRPYADLMLSGNPEMLGEGWFGTSFASPHAAGIAAEILGTGTSDDIGEILMIDSGFVSEIPMGEMLVHDSIIMM